MLFMCDEVRVYCVLSRLSFCACVCVCVCALGLVGMVSEGDHASVPRPESQTRVSSPGWNIAPSGPEHTAWCQRTTHTHNHICIHTHSRTHTLTHMHTHTHAHTCRHSCTHSRTQMQTHTHTHAQTLMHMYTLTHRHTLWGVICVSG